jgi:hypothetical protein
VNRMALAGWERVEMSDSMPRKKLKKKAKQL